MDKLEEMFKLQNQLELTLGYDIAVMPMKERVAFIKEYCMHMEHEMHEMLQELPYFKAWKVYPDSDFEQFRMTHKAMEEWIDVLHFFLNVSLALGFDAQTMVGMFLDKNALNHNRQHDAAYKKCVEVQDETGAIE